MTAQELLSLAEKRSRTFYSVGEVLLYRAALRARASSEAGGRG